MLLPSQPGHSIELNCQNPSCRTQLPELLTATIHPKAGHPLAGPKPLQNAAAVSRDDSICRCRRRRYAGKPRRLSLKFLREERARLEAWRESVRAHYAATGAPDAPPGASLGGWVTEAGMARQNLD